VALICNLVQEFNGLVSKGPAQKAGPFTFYFTAKFKLPLFFIFE
jgi:hypothetical protein